MRIFPVIRALALSVIVVACASQKPSVGVPPAGTDMSGSWERLKQGLTGTWSTTPEQGRALEISYRVVSHGTALLETFGAAAADQTLSVYHPDGRSLMLTHYCAQGNQVRLRATEASADRITFRYIDATNVDAKQSVMHELVFALGPDTLDRTEVYRELDGTAHTSVVHLVRK